MRPSTALLRIEFTAMGAFTRHRVSSYLTFPPLPPHGGAVVYFCCTFPRVAPGGCYPLSLPYGARTFLTHGPFAPQARLSSLLARLFYAILPGLSNQKRSAFAFSLQVGYNKLVKL